MLNREQGDMSRLLEEDKELNAYLQLLRAPKKINHILIDQPYW